MRGKIVLAVYSDTMEFGELGTDIDTKLSLIHTTIDKKYPLCSRSITTNSWKYEIPFVGGSDFIVRLDARPQRRYVRPHAPLGPQ